MEEITAAEKKVAGESAHNNVPQAVQARKKLEITKDFNSSFPNNMHAVIVVAYVELTKRQKVQAR